MGWNQNFSLCSKENLQSLRLPAKKLWVTMTWFFFELWLDIFCWTAVTWYLFKNVHLQDEHLVDILGGQRVKIYRCTVILCGVYTNIKYIYYSHLKCINYEDRRQIGTWATLKKKIVKTLKGFKRFQCTYLPPTNFDLLQSWFWWWWQK